MISMIRPQCREYVLKSSFGFSVEKLPQEQEQMIQDFINRLLYISAESPAVINRY